MNTRYDIVIVGGGMVGATLAAALADCALNIAIIEPHLPAVFSSEQEHDLRVSALNIASQNILQNIGAWQGIKDRRSCEYRRLKTWELDDTRAATLFDCSEYGAPYLGHIVENRVIQLSLLERLKAAENITLINRQTISIDYHPGASLIELSDGQQLVAKLLVGADGGQSQVRTAAGIGIHSWDYQQSALVVNVEMAAEQQDITWQQFTATGPLAFLPLSGSSASLVWYNTPSAVKQLQALDDASFLQQLQHTFPDALAKVSKVYARGAFPLKRQHAQKYVLEGVALIGDAAHMIHPLAGQGVNIGLLDAAQLAEVLLDALEKGEGVDQLEVLMDYQSLRRNHNFIMMQLMDSFYRVFSNEIPPLKVLRNIGLALAGKITPARKKAMALAMGIEGPLPHLAK